MTLWLITRSATCAPHAAECDSMDEAAEMLAEIIDICPGAKVWDDNGDRDLTGDALAMIAIWNDEAAADYDGPELDEYGWTAADYREWDGWNDARAGV